jgi:hypothetical protein
MGWDIQINPTAEANHVSPALVEVLDEFVEDFEIRYCALQPDPAAIAALRGVQARSREEEAAIARMISELERGNAVELLIGH